MSERGTEREREKERDYVVDGGACLSERCPCKRQ